MLGKHRIALISITILAAVSLFSSAAFAQWPKMLKVVAGDPFGTLPASGPSMVTIDASAEETEPGTFWASYNKTLTNARVAAAGDFVGPKKNKIERQNIEVSLVQNGRLVSKVSQTSGAVFADADITSQPTQFWVSVNVPRRTAPGTYRGDVAFYVDNKFFDKVPVEVNVRPMRLIGSSKQYGVYTSVGPQDFSEDAAYKDFLSAFAELQINAGSVNAAPDALAPALATYKAAGLGSPVLVTTYSFSSEVPTANQVMEMEKARRAAGISSGRYFIHQNPCNEEIASIAERQAYNIKVARGKVMVLADSPCVPESVMRYVDDLSYWIGSDYIQSIISGETKPTFDKWEWYWWDARNATAIENRRNAGVLLWKSGLFGSLAAWMPEEGKGPMDGVDTVAMIALREGIDDTRYLTSFMRVLRELKDLKRAKDKEAIEEAEGYVNAFLSKPLTNVTAAELNTFRDKVAVYTASLSNRL